MNKNKTKQKKIERTHYVGQITYTNLVIHIVYSSFIPASSIRDSTKWSQEDFCDLPPTWTADQQACSGRGEQPPSSQLNYQSSISLISVTKNHKVKFLHFSASINEQQKRPDIAHYPTCGTRDRSLEEKAFKIVHVEGGSSL